ncbi:hypothetical protein HPB51_009821 [Rhipicephalus microplus]|uniref:Tick transposon n=1 Tax=Rhipicephalus microplus TaxID=6941 RepID=A0A9J6F1A1_RHIMP|nr:hypothetical protein HPB51_009821 [Rhipicephalus microplus]
MWRIGMIKKSAQEIYRTFKQEIAKERIYDNIRGSSLLFEARTGVLRTKTYRAKYEGVEATTVQNCLKRAGFSVSAGHADAASDTTDQTSDIVDEACKTLLAEVLERQGIMEGIFFPDFRDADSNVQTSPDMSGEAIVASVVEVSPNDSDEDDMESENTGDLGPTVAEAAHCVSVMRVFAEKRGLAEKLAHSISEFEAAVVAARPPRRQMKITDFVTRSE